RRLFSATTAAAAATGRLRPLNVQGHIAPERHILPRPAVELNHARAARHQAAKRRRQREQHAVGARDWNDLAVRVHRDNRAHIWIELANFLSVDRGPYRIDFDQAYIVPRLEQG